MDVLDCTVMVSAYRGMCKFSKESCITDQNIFTVLPEFMFMLEPSGKKKRKHYSKNRLMFTKQLLCLIQVISIRCTSIEAEGGHRPVIVKRAVIGSKGGWKLSTIFLSCN